MIAILTVLLYTLWLRNVAGEGAMLHTRQTLQSGEWQYPMNSIVYLCNLTGTYTYSATLQSQGCHKSGAWTYPHAVLLIGSEQNGTKTFDKNPYNFKLETMVNVIGTSALQIDDLDFASAEGWDYLEQEAKFRTYDGGIDLINLRPNTTGAPTIQKIFADWHDGFLISGDQSGYGGNESRILAVTANLLDYPGPDVCHYRQKYYFNASTTWNWTISFTNITANGSMFSTQLGAPLNLEFSCGRQDNDTYPYNLPFYYEFFESERIELWANGTSPVFHNWNTNTIAPTTSSGNKSNTVILWDSVFQAMALSFLVSIVVMMVSV